MPIPTDTELRRQFPALSGTTRYLDNAGGSQLPACVINAANRCLGGEYAQLGGAYGPSLAAGRNVDRARRVARAFLNAAGVGEVVLGPSATALCNMLSQCYADATVDGGRNEVIVATSGHEANIGAWARLARRGWRVTLWPTEHSGDGWRPRVDTLRRLISARTRIVAFPQVSNILGEVWDAADVAAVAREHGAHSVIDGVAYAPHAAPDVRELGCDWYVYSTYKVMGPHMGVLFGRSEAMAGLSGPNHEFLARDAAYRAFEPGGCPHEGCAMLAALWDYVCAVAGAEASDEIERRPFEQAFARFGAMERAIQARLLDGLGSIPGLRIVGPRDDAPNRVCTVSFLMEGRRPSDVATRANQRGLGIRWGHFYAKRLIEELGLDPAEGVIRASLLHYTCNDEVDELVRFLRDVA